jgi:hypothetical protein
MPRNALAASHIVAIPPKGSTDNENVLSDDPKGRAFAYFGRKECAVWQGTV